MYQCLHFINATKTLFHSFSSLVVVSNLVICIEIDGLMSALNISHKSEEWRVFIDSSQLSLKAVFLHNGNMLPSIPVGHAVHMKETYDDMKLRLDCTNYEKYKWQLCGDLNVIAILFGPQQGYI